MKLKVRVCLQAGGARRGVSRLSTITFRGRGSTSAIARNLLNLLLTLNSRLVLASPQLLILRGVPLRNKALGVRNS